jgi:hypothetical protein
MLSAINVRASKFNVHLNNTNARGPMSRLGLPIEVIGQFEERDGGARDGLIAASFGPKANPETGATR